MCNEFVSINAVFFFFVSLIVVTALMHWAWACATTFRVSLRTHLFAHLNTTRFFFFLLYPFCELKYSNLFDIRLKIISMQVTFFTSLFFLFKSVRIYARSLSVVVFESRKTTYILYAMECSPYKILSKLYTDGMCVTNRNRREKKAFISIECYGKCQYCTRCVHSHAKLNEKRWQNHNKTHKLTSVWVVRSN